ncbi:YolD-like family protein [Brevibacillus reuszeri]|uniref:YolD-like family protein n=1 Tax=Brevibacillus reuszeri TaxID=54915 RepID=UPI00366BC8C9
MATKIENPLSMRFVLPEQRALYLQIKEDDKLFSMSYLEQDELESFHYLIRDSAREDYAIFVTWWKPVKGELGSTCEMLGVVKWIDQNGRRIKLVNDEDVQWITMDRIISVGTYRKVPRTPSRALAFAGAPSFTDTYSKMADRCRYLKKNPFPQIGDGLFIK